MNIEKRETETYVLTDLERLDPVTVYVTNYKPGEGKIVIECYGQSWTAYWGSMSGRALQEFVIGCDNGYIIGKMVSNTSQTDYDKVGELAEERGFDICVTSDVEIAMMADDMAECFGSDWMMDLPTRRTPESEYLDRILNAVKQAFRQEQPSPLAATTTGLRPGGE